MEIEKQTIRAEEYVSLTSRVIAVNAIFIKITGNTSDAIVLSQLIYWATKMKFKEFYKTDKELSEETMIPERSIFRIKQRLEEQGLISTKVKTSKTNTYYTINYELIYNMMECIVNTGIRKVRGTNTQNAQSIYNDNNRLHNKLRVETDDPLDEGVSSPRKETFKEEVNVGGSDSELGTTETETLVYEGEENKPKKTAKTNKKDKDIKTFIYQFKTNYEKVFKRKASFSYGLCYKLVNSALNDYSLDQLLSFGPVFFEDAMKSKPNPYWQSRSYSMQTFLSKETLNNLYNLYEQSKSIW